jgi:hypothetical protein
MREFSLPGAVAPHSSRLEDVRSARRGRLHRRRAPSEEGPRLDEAAARITALDDVFQLADVAGRVCDRQLQRVLATPSTAYPALLLNWRMKW